MSEVVSPEMLRRLLRYEPETGKLYWLRRCEDLFDATEGRAVQHLAKWWNSRFAGQEALTARSHYEGGHGKIFGKLYYASRVAWTLAHGSWPDGDIDHINGDRNDNRIVNLRVVTHAQNMGNKKLYRTNTSGVPGVTWHRGKQRWQAFIRSGVNRRHLGSFANVEDAIAARRDAQRADTGFHSNHGRR